ncbi:MAG TPA: DUF438 domain-containing protein [Sphaerochaeta sp.]|nr:DUF438 domain-containing protein [Sphaerochaeta sp.]
MDDTKITRLKEIIERLHHGESSDSVKADFEKDFGTIAAEELAAAERKLMESGEVTVEQVMKLCDVHAAVFGDSIEAIHAKEAITQQSGHPAFVFMQENVGLLAFLDATFVPAKDAYLRGADTANSEALLGALSELSKLDRHYSRKENLLFPYMEKAGITAPPKVMWGVDDEIRTLFKGAIASLEAGEEVSSEHLNELEEQVRSMVSKEDTILMPMLEGVMQADDWLAVARDSPEIGYAFNAGIEGASPSDATTWYRWQASLSGELDEHKAEQVAGQVVLPSGSMNLEELTWMLNSLPFDITFVGADDRVRYFSEAKDRIFPRTRTIVGREVAHCHPPKSLDIVERLVEDFKAGRKDSESFWLQTGGKFILIRYYAVRNDQGEYLGVVETSEEISQLRSLEGEKRLSN